VNRESSDPRGPRPTPRSHCHPARRTHPTLKYEEPDSVAENNRQIAAYLAVAQPVNVTLSADDI